MTHPVEFGKNSDNQLREAKKSSLSKPVSVSGLLFSTMVLPLALLIHQWFSLDLLLWSWMCGLYYSIPYILEESWIGFQRFVIFSLLLSAISLFVGLNTEGVLAFLAVVSILRCWHFRSLLQNPLMGLNGFLIHFGGHVCSLIGMQSVYYALNSTIGSSIIIGLGLFGSFSQLFIEWMFQKTLLDFQDRAILEMDLSEHYQPLLEELNSIPTPEQASPELLGNFKLLRMRLKERIWEGSRLNDQLDLFDRIELRSKVSKYERDFEHESDEALKSVLKNRLEQARTARNWYESQSKYEQKLYTTIEADLMYLRNQTLLIKDLNQKEDQLDRRAEIRSLQESLQEKLLQMRERLEALDEINQS